MNIQYLEEDVVIVEPSTDDNGGLDFENTIELREALLDLKKENRIKIILDMSLVNSICCYSIGVFVVFSRDLRDLGGDLRFLGLQGCSRQAFKEINTDGILEVFEIKEDAVKSFKGD